MNQELAKREIILPEVKQEILRAINRGYVNTAEDIAEIFPVSEQEAVELLNDDEFYLSIANNTRARMRMLYNTKGVDVLERLLDSEKSGDNIAAYDRLAKATGGIQEEKNSTNNFNFFNIEDLLEVKEKVINRKEKTIDLPKNQFNRVKSKREKSEDLPGETINGNIFENEADDEELGYEIEEMFEESEELEL